MGKSPSITIRSPSGNITLQMTQSISIKQHILYINNQTLYLCHCFGGKPNLLTICDSVGVVVLFSVLISVGVGSVRISVGVGSVRVSVGVGSARISVGVGSVRVSVGVGSLDGFK